jgi:self-protective colicin-like immunity protein
LNVLGQRKLAGIISANEYISEWQKLVKKVMGCEVDIGTEIDKSLGHLFVECDAYEPDPEWRESYQIGEPELREETRKTLEILTAK